MITRKTVLILGAGASYPDGFPLGSELIDRICTHPAHYIVHHPGFNDHGAKLSLHPSFEDQTAEYFFFSALTASYGESRALDAIRLIKIIHAYGQLGNPYFLSEEGRPYTTALNRDVIAKCVKEIKVIPEDRDGAIEFQEATQVIKSSNAVCFLGFGYNPTNGAL